MDLIQQKDGLRQESRLSCSGPSFFPAGVQFRDIPRLFAEWNTYIKTKEMIFLSDASIGFLMALYRDERRQLLEKARHAASRSYLICVQAYRALP